MVLYGVKFYIDDLVIISLFYDVKIRRNDSVICLCSNIGMEQRLRWERLSLKDYNFFIFYVEIRVYYFSFFVIVVIKGYFEVRKIIRVGVGGCFYIFEVFGVEVFFLEILLFYDIEVFVKVFYVDEFYDVDYLDFEVFGFVILVVQLGFYGCIFNFYFIDFVIVRFFLLNGKEIQERYDDRQFIFWCSSIIDDEDLEWQQFQFKFIYIDNDNDNLCFVYFSVEYFIFFRVLWNIVDFILWEVKFGVFCIILVFQFNVFF